jgi:peptidoglycan/xylan/chitin deacetylase (PgdA/CDA1 family)
MKALMYHYVRPTMDEPPYGYYHLPLESFRRQLDHLQANYDLLSREAFFECVRGERTPPKDAAILTFDDGLEDHHRWVLPELEKRGLWGVFFVPSGPLAAGRPLPVHRVHTLAGSVQADRLVETLVSLLHEEGVLDTAAEDYQGMYTRQETPEQVRTFKEILNQEVSYRALGDVLDRLEAAFPNSRAGVDPGKYYLTREQVLDLVDAGMVVGAHTVSHRILSRLPPAEQRAEVADSRDYLSSILEEPVTVFGYPYGASSTYTDETVGIVGDEGFEAAFTTEPRAATAEDFRERPLQLPRFDCTELVHGGSRESLPRMGSRPEQEAGAEILD